MLEKIQELMGRYNENKKVFVEEYRKELGIIFAEIFKEHKGIESFGWAQYTPYFNDGDDCIFRVCSDPESIIVNGEARYNLEDELEGKLDALSGDDKHRAERQAIKAQLEAVKEVSEKVSDVLDNVPEHLLEDLYGDHAEVTFFPDGTVTVETYEHD